MFSRRWAIGTLILLCGCGDSTAGTLAVSTISVSAGWRGLSYSTTLEASGGDGSYAWSVVAGTLPTGLSLSSVGHISGIPTSPSEDVVFQVMSGGQTATREFPVSIRARLSPFERCADWGFGSVASFEDVMIESAVRARYALPTRELGCSDLAARPFGGMYLDSAGVISIAGVQNLLGLTWLQLIENDVSDVSFLAGQSSLRVVFLPYNSVTDIGGLSGLPSLERLYLYDNAVADLGPLADLMNLRQLGLGANQISDLSPLRTLVGLNELGLGENDIVDLAPLADLTQLTQLNLERNQITDVTPLRDLTSLTYLGLGFNTGLSDIQPLLDNPGLGPGDQVNLAFTAANCAEIAALEARQVTVFANCP